MFFKHTSHKRKYINGQLKSEQFSETELDIAIDTNHENDNRDFITKFIDIFDSKKAAYFYVCFGLLYLLCNIQLCIR